MRKSLLVLGMCLVSVLNTLAQTINLTSPSGQNDTQSEHVNNLSFSELKDSKVVRSQAVFGLTVGMNSSIVNFFLPDVNVLYDHISSQSSRSTTAIVGVSLNVYPVNPDNKIFFSSNLMIHNSTFKSYNEVPNENVSVQRNYVTNRVSQIKLPVGIGYSFNEIKFQPYLNFGLSGTYHLNFDSDWRQEEQFADRVETKEVIALPLKKFQMGIWTGVGVKHDINEKYATFLEMRYEITNGFVRINVTNIEPRAIVSSFQLVTGIKFNR